jgi:hypothetical protein
MISQHVVHKDYIHKQRQAKIEWPVGADRKEQASSQVSTDKEQAAWLNTADKGLKQHYCQQIMASRNEAI